MLIETSRLILRPLVVADNEALNQVLADEQVMEFSEGVKTPDEIRQWVDQQIANYSLHAGKGPYAVVLKEESRLIGYCGLFVFDDIDGQPEIEIGYRLAPAYWKQGYATEAASAVRDYAFCVLKIPRLVAMVDPDNIASVKVAQKLGMSFEKNIMMEGYDHPDHLYVVQQLIGE